MYLYDSFSVKETSKSYVVTREIPGEGNIKARISKEIVEKINSNEDSEMVAIVCAVVEFVRFDAKKVGKKAEKTLLYEDGFIEGIRFLLQHSSVEEIIEEFLQQKFYELKERFS